MPAELQRATAQSLQLHNSLSSFRQSQVPAKMPAPTYIISRVADPIFAVVIGASAALTRINREEKAQGRTTNDTIQAGRRYD